MRASLPAPCATSFVLAAAFLLAAPAPAAGSRATRCEDASIEARVPWHQHVAALLHLSRQDGADKPAELGSGLASMGVPALAVLLDVSRTGRVETAPGDRSLDLVLDEQELALLRAAVQQLGRDAVLPLCQSALLAGPLAEDDAVRNALHGLELVGRADDLELALALLVVAGAEDAGFLAQQRDLERAVQAIAARDAQALRSLHRLLERCGDASACSLVRGMARSGRPEAATVLADELDRQPRRAALLLCELGRAAAHASRPFDLRMLLEVRERLGDADPSVARAAVEALGGLDDFDSLPLLIDLLQGGDPGLRDSALRSLRQLSGLRFEGVPGTWSAWLEREARWFRHRVPELEQELDASEPGRVIAALREIAGHRYRRDELVELVTPALEHESPAVRACACATLAALGSRACAQRLLERLDDEVEAVALAARSCLRAVTGQHLEAGREAWSRLLASPQ